MAIEYFCAYYSFIDALRELTDEEVGRLFMACLSYGKTGKAPQLAGNERFVFPLIRAQIDRDNERYRQRCEKNAANARSRYEREASDANGCERMPSDANGCETCQEKDKDKDNISSCDDSFESHEAKPTKHFFARDSNPYRAAKYLSEKILERLPTVKPHDERTLQSWADAFDKCHRLDGHDWPEIERVLMFSQQDSFWQTNVLSGVKFRKQYVQLLARMGGDAE